MSSAISINRGIAGLAILVAISAIVFVLSNSPVEKTNDKLIGSRKAMQLTLKSVEGYSRFELDQAEGAFDLKSKFVQSDFAPDRRSFLYNHKESGRALKKGKMGKRNKSTHSGKGKSGSMSSKGKGFSVDECVALKDTETSGKGMMKKKNAGKGMMMMMKKKNTRFLNDGNIRIEEKIINDDPRLTSRRVLKMSKNSMSSSKGMGGKTMSMRKKKKNSKNGSGIFVLKGKSGRSGKGKSGKRSKGSDIVPVSQSIENLKTW